MDTTTLFDGCNVVLSEESRTRLELFERWLPGVSTRTARTITEFWNVFDEHTIVAGISRPLFGADETRIRNEVLLRNLHCRIVAFLPHGASVPSMTNEYDAYLRRPVYRRPLQDTIETQLKYGLYSHTLHEFYSLNAELSRFGRGKSTGLETVADGRERLERYRTLKTRLDALQTHLDVTDLDAILNTLKLHSRHLSEPAKDAETTRSSKYHPARCPLCKLPWGVDHRNTLGLGMERVGAYVWKCKRCAEITHGLGASHRRVLR